MQIGILGSGLMGGKLGTIFARAGHDVVFSYARSEQKLKRLARESQGNARAGTPSEAARDADALLLAVHWSRVDDVLKQAGDVSGQGHRQLLAPDERGRHRSRHRPHVIGRGGTCQESSTRSRRLRVRHGAE
jgi:3-hydroxyisobutyrate dehydrogenase-like beta-hydroxyacid dehydrogenase